MRALSDIRQRFPQWHIGPSVAGWRATPRATWSVGAPTLEDLYRRLKREEDRREGAARDEPGHSEAISPGIPPGILPRPRQAPP